jgi:hypothetical protein
MVSWEENVARVKQYLRYDWQETIGLAAAVLLSGFLFAMYQKGGSFDIFTGIRNFVYVVIIAAVSFLFRTGFQKFYALSQGHYAKFKVWWAGLLASLVIAFVTATLSNGRFVIPLLLIGGTSVSFMTRIRLGEFRYGISMWVNSMIGYWAVIGHLIMAILFAIGVQISPDSYFFNTGVIFNLIGAACAVLPIPQLDGPSIFFGMRGMYYLAWILIALAAVLLLTKTLFGLLFAIIVGAIYGGIIQLIGSEV